MRKTYLLLHLAVILAGFTGIFGKLITLNEGLLVFYRVLFSAIMLFILLRLKRQNTALTKQQKLKIAGAGMLLTLHWILFYGSIKYANISIGVVCFCLTSFFTAIFEPIINKRKFNLREMLLSLLTLLGIALIFSFDSTYQVGIAIGVLSSAFAALYTIYSQKFSVNQDSKQVNYYQMLGGTIGLGALLPIYLYFFPVQTIIPSLSDTFYLLLLAGFCTVALYVINITVLKTLSAFTVNLTFNLEPIYSIIMAFLFFNEAKELGYSFYIGLALVLSSVVMQTLLSMRKSKDNLTVQVN